MAQVILQDLEKIYPPAKKQAAFRAVKGINLEIKAGEFMVLVGPSGCGKSTTLRMIAGLEDVTSGTVTIGDRIVNDTMPKDRGIAMVFQNYALYPHMSVFDNMAFGLKLAKTPKAEIHQRVTAAAEVLGLETLLDRKPKALSGGQRQRVAVGRAIVRQPDVFLFDEPLSNLDAKMRVSMRTEISKLHANLAATMIYVTHDQIEAMTMGDRICVMRDGQIMQVADPIKLYQEPANAYVASFIGSPPMNLVHGEIQEEASEVWFREKVTPDATAESPPRLELKLEGSLAQTAREAPAAQVILGIRPEDLALATSDDTTPISTRIEAVETMGAETYLHTSSGAHQLIARLPGSSRHPLGEIVRLKPKNAKMHLFDARSEQSLHTEKHFSIRGKESE
jgi:multiple sugar transport system ATP-binding protein